VCGRRGTNTEQRAISSYLRADGMSFIVAMEVLSIPGARDRRYGTLQLVVGGPLEVGGMGGGESAGIDVLRKG